MWVYETDWGHTLYTLDGLRSVVSENYPFEDVDFFDWFDSLFARGSLVPRAIYDAFDPMECESGMGVPASALVSTRVTWEIRTSRGTDEFSLNLMDALLTMTNVNGLKIDESIIWNNAVRDELLVEFSKFDNSTTPDDYALAAADRVLRNRGFLK